MNFWEQYTLLHFSNAAFVISATCALALDKVSFDSWQITAATYAITNVFSQSAVFWFNFLLDCVIYAFSCMYGVTKKCFRQQFWNFIKKLFSIEEFL